MGKNATLLAFDPGASSGRYIGELHRDMPGIWREKQAALGSLGSHGVERPDSIGVDTWGVAGALAAAEFLLTIPDLLNFWLTGVVACGYTNATTTQFLDRRGSNRRATRVAPVRGYLMKRVCFCLQVKRGRLEEYKARHAEVWPEMLEALRRAGWHNYSLFLRHDGLLIGCLETPDFDRAVALMAATEVNRKWQAEMADFFDGGPGRKADEQMEPIPEIFHLP